MDKLNMFLLRVVVSEELVLLLRLVDWELFELLLDEVLEEEPDEVLEEEPN